MDINKEFIKQTQPHGGITWKDDYCTRTGDGYMACLHVYKMPAHVADHWLMNLTNIENTICTVDINTEDQAEVVKNLNRSLNEQEDRYEKAQSRGEQKRAEATYVKMDGLLQDITTLDEVVKSVTIRIFVYNRSREKLEEQVADIANQLEGRYSISASVFMCEAKREWESLFESYEKQEAKPFNLDGTPLVSEAVAAGNPFHFSSLNDAAGDFLGETPCGGNVLFDLFAKTARRMYYNGVVIGKMGSGKSTLLKKLFLSRAIRGDYVRTFDVNGEFSQLTESLGGQVLSLDGTQGILNPLEILAAGDNENVSYTRHISKVSTIYRFLVPEATSGEVTTFANTLGEMYQSIGMTPDQGRITGHEPTKYPIFSDFYRYIEKKIDDMCKMEYSAAELEVAKTELAHLSSIKQTLKKIISIYGSVLDGHTSIKNILDEQIITFNIKNLREMESNIFDAQIFNVLSLSWDNCVKIGSRMKQQWEEEKIDWNDITRFLILIDESHSWINAQKQQAVDLVSLYQREARKFFGGIVLASQSIRDYVPEGTNDKDLEKLKKIFELSQYKFIFLQDTEVLPLINRCFGGVLTDAQLDAIPRLTTGECILNVSPQESLQMNVYLSKEENAVFSGGA